MLAAGAFALTLADVAFMTPPPHRPDRPERRAGGRGVARTLFATFHRELALALRDRADGSLPSVTARYPY